MSLLLTTVSENVTVLDLKGYTFVHPTVNFVLYDLFTIQDIEDSVDLQTELNAGNVTITDSNGKDITNLSITDVMFNTTYDSNNDGKIDPDASQVESVNGQTGLVNINEPNFTGTTGIAGAGDGVVVDDGVDSTGDRTLHDDGIFKNVTFTKTVELDPGTDVTVVEMEELTDASITSLHKHRNLCDETGTVRLDSLNGGEVRLTLYNSGKDDGVSSYNRNLYIDNTGIIKVGDNRSSFITGSGRFHCQTNNRWTTESDDLYGSNTNNHNENCGTGTDPNVEWEHLGTLLPSGIFVNNLHFIARSNNTQVTDFEISIIEKKPIDINFYNIGFDADAEVVTSELYRGLWTSAIIGYAGNSNDMHAAVLNINHLLTDRAQISIYIKPVGNLSATRYIYASWSWEIK